MLDEATIRKPGFSEGVKVVLGDGREWALPRPRLVFFPSLGSAGSYPTRMRLSYGRECDALFARAFSPDHEADDDEALIAARMNLACVLLVSNYALESDDLVDLLTIRPEEPESVAWWSALNDAISSQVRLESVASPTE